MPQALSLLLRLCCAALMLCAGHAQAAPAHALRIVGGLGGLHQYTVHEEPFWTRELARLSEGKYSADIVPFDRAGVPAAEMLRLIQLGVIPFGTTLLSAISNQYPEYGAMDLAGLNPDMLTLKASVAAFRPYLEKQLREHFGIEVLAVYAYPAQVIFCKRPMSALADLAGRRVRVSSASQADFVSALGGVPVLTDFSALMSHMKSGNIECAITSSLAANSLGLQDLSTHVHALPVNWGLSVFGANQAAWNALAPDLKALLRHELPRLEADIWAAADHETGQGLACNSGAPSCTTARKGRLVVVPLSAQDERRRQEVFASAVLQRWLQRCSRTCAEVWNLTLGPVRGVIAAPTK